MTTRRRYSCIVADPPWKQPSGGPRSQESWSQGKPSRLPYPTMDLDEIKALPVKEMAEKNAHLYLWATNSHLDNAFDVARAWGFEASTTLVWCKPPSGRGMGGAFTITTEFVLFCRRGSLAFLEKQESSWWEWKRSQHSRKPEAFLDLVERVSPGPYLELFARRNRLGWATWGNESLQHEEIA